jgi:excisionase family DNA binding protein
MQVHETRDALLVGPKEAARLLSVSPRTLWAMTFEQEDPLPYVRLGRLVRYSPSDLQAWLSQRAARTRQGGSDGE